MAGPELERAFTTLADAFGTTETEINEEIKLLHQQIEDLKGRIVELNGKQETLAHDRTAIEEIYNRYTTGDGAKAAS